jgi:hypothetical protein
MPNSPEVMLDEVMGRYLRSCCVCFRGATRLLHGLVILEDVPAFCDRHGIEDSSKYRVMSTAEYEVLPQAELVRRYEALHRCQGPLPECAWHGAVEGFVETVNARFCVGSPQPESVWVRIRPPSEEELEVQRGDPKMMPFLRVGSLAHVLSCFSGGPRRTEYIEIRVGSTAATYTLEAFMRTYIKTVDWTPEQEGPLHG